MWTDFVAESLTLGFFTLLAPVLAGGVLYLLLAVPLYRLGYYDPRLTYEGSFGPYYTMHHLGLTFSAVFWVGVGVLSVLFVVGSLVQVVV